jgi:hypothetical protein
MISPARKSMAAFLLSILFLPICGTCIAGEKVSLSILKNVLKKNERLLSFKIAISAGRIVSLRDIPIGWDVHIDNNASWNTNISANATVVAAALESDFLKDFLVIEKAEPPLVPFAINAQIGMFTQGTEEQRSVQLKTKDVRLRKLSTKKSGPTL